MRRHQNAPAIAGVGPSVVRTLEGRAVDHLPEEQPCTSVHTQVPPGEVLRARTPQDDVLAQETRTTRPTRSELDNARHRVPVIDEDRIVDHGSGQTLTVRDGGRLRAAQVLLYAGPESGRDTLLARRGPTQARRGRVAQRPRP